MVGKPVIVLDMDGVIATGTKDSVYSEEAGFAYENCVPVDGALDGVRELSERFSVYIDSARKECDYGKTLDWLIKYGFIQYIDEIRVGQKLPAVAYIDDKGYKFTSWEQTCKDFSDSCDCNLIPEGVEP